jgi:fermentation-respiration switch protein FrsA (DUF1100 family)
MAMCSSNKRRFAITAGWFFCVASFLGCQGVDAPEGEWKTQPTGGPVVTFDLFAKPLPEVPLPNDIATRPERSSPTGRRINASHIAPTRLESGVRRRMDRLDGWGTYGAITVSFQPEDQLLDVGNILSRHAGDDFDFTDDAIYLIDITKGSPTYGEPMPLDLGEGNFPPNLERRDRYYDNDPRGSTSNLLFDTTYEDTNGNGRLDLCEDVNGNGVADPGEDLDGDGVVFRAERDENGDGVVDPEEDLNGNGRLDCSEDTDFDGHLDVPNLYCGTDGQSGRIPPWQCDDGALPNPYGDDRVFPADDRWLVDFYEMETNTLVMRPVIPLRERTEYAVVLTNRLVDEAGRPVQSPFESVHHVDQLRSIRRLGDILGDANNSGHYGGLSGRDIQFAWTFTTQTVTHEMRDVREGLYGRGPLAELADEFPPELRVDVAHGCYGGGDGCGLPENLYVINAHTTEEGPGLIDLLEEYAGDAFGLDPEEFQPLADTYDYVDYMVHVRFQSPNYLDNDGVSEDLDGDGRLDEVDEDVNGNGVLDPGEDLDVDGHLDVDEDVDDDHVLDGEEGHFLLDTARGYHPHNQHEVTGFITIPRPDPDRGIEPPFPVVLYAHGYTSMGLESLGFAGSLAKFGFATVGLNCAHHGIELDPSLATLVEAALVDNKLGGLASAIFSDRARDLNGDGRKDSGGDFWTAYVFHTRDLVRQSGIDHMRMIRVLRAFDGELMSGTDYDGDGREDLSGDFNGDGVVDLGGADNDYYVWGQSLGGIMSAFLAGLEPAVTAAAPVAGGGGLGDVGIRSIQGGVKEAVILRMMGPIMFTEPADRHYELMHCSAGADCPSGEACIESVCRCERNIDCAGGGGFHCYDPPSRRLSDPRKVCAKPRETSCTTNQISARFLVPDLNDTGEVEYGCLDTDEVRTGDTVVAENLANGERGCFVAWPDGRSRVHLASDLYDPVRVTVYEGEVLTDTEHCEVRQGAAVRRVIDQWEVDAEFQLDEWAAGDALVAPAEGFGLKRATPELRRFMGIAQMVLDPGDPVNMALHYFEDPVDFGPETSPSNVMVIATIGDMNVPINTGIAIARAAGILEIAPHGQQASLDPRLADESNPQGRTANRFLIDNHVIMGLERISPFFRPDGRQVLYDPDDLDRAASPPYQGWEGDGLGAPSPEVPLRVWRRRDDSSDCSCIDGQGSHSCTWPGDTSGPLEMVRCDQGVSALVMPYLDEHGKHGFTVPEPNRQFDINTFMINMVGWYFYTGGKEIRYDVCMATNSCTEQEHGFYVPPVPRQ